MAAVAPRHAPRAWLIVADDLTGAADTGIAFARRGLATVVTWRDGDTWGDATAGHGIGDVPVIAVDTDSRRLPAAAAAARQSAALAAHRTQGRIVYKKIDSTLRGQPAAETAALLADLRRHDHRTIAFVAPAFPATGRTTEAGRVLVNGQRLEDTPIFARDHSYDTGALPEVLKTAGLESGVVPLDQLRRGAGVVRGIVENAMAEGCDAVVCDAATPEDLLVAAEAVLPLADRMLFVGTGGLASALARRVAPAEPPPPALPPVTGPVLVLVGSVAEASRAAADALAASGRVTPVQVPEAVLRAAPGADTAGRELTAKIGAALGDGHVLVVTEFGPGSDLAAGGAVAARLADLVGPATAHLGGLVATGGDTVCALLGRIGVTGIRLVDEVEPGVPLGVTVGALALPIATKAGGFGTDATLLHCLDRLTTTSPASEKA
ncbi:four-carbon acid sugar kinase family protein [Rhodoplanes azumiensis]|uniref:Four-carbon acid sugar kinase family protein n=1 Tax=Rhodoplanes azumiensis TaxID=1897628 RepID=A0ABW5AEF7_9BRAD